MKEADIFGKRLPEKALWEHSKIFLNNQEREKLGTDNSNIIL